MKIVHVHLLGPYTDNWGYQENILPEIQARQGHTVTVITSCLAHRSDGSIIEVNPGKYSLNGVEIIRIHRRNISRSKRVNAIVSYYPIMDLLKKLKPDILLLHGMGKGITNFEVRKYVQKHSECKLFGDVHAFTGNTSTKHGIIANISSLFVRICRQLLYPYYSYVLCISNQCMDYARNVYKIPEEKLKLFPLGYDPSNIDWENRDVIRNEFREKHGIASDEIVIVHGGKIIPRRKTEMAVEVVCQLKHKIRLVVFGGIDEQIKENILACFEKCQGLIYLGHISQKEYLNVFLASDIALFPGGQSSMWEEAIGCGLPMFVNTTEKNDAPYFDRGGNIVFSDDTVQSFVEILNDAITSGNYKDMAQVARTKGRDFFSYDRISEIMTKEKNESKSDKE